MFHRFLAPTLRASLAEMPVVTLIGPRQSGKTTLARTCLPDHAYHSLEDPDARSFATADPRGFLSRFERTPAILDEVQRAPDLLSYLQRMVDEDARPGRFVLTGSYNLPLLEKVSQSLAGRTAILTLLPLSLAERHQRAPWAPADLLDPVASPAPPDGLWPTVWAGLYPRIHSNALRPHAWLASYYRTYVERDVLELVRVSRPDAFDRFVRACAACTGQELNFAGLAADCGISAPTAAGWLDALRKSYLVTLLPPHRVSYRKRLRKHPKLHFLDTGLACYLLGIASPEQLATHPLRGALFETFVVSELTKAFTHAGVEPPLHFWRDATGHELDALVDLGSSVIPLEVKSGATVPEDAFTTLSWWMGLPGNPHQRGLLVHGGAASYLRRGITVRPWWVA